MKLVFALLVSLLAAFHHSARAEMKVHPSLKTLVAKCAKNVERYEDSAICPSVEEYRFKRLTLSKALQWLKTESEAHIQYDPKLATRRAAADLIRNSMRYQLAALRSEVGDHRQVVRDHVKNIDAIHEALFQIALGGEVYTDPDTYWGPSVNARGWFLIDLRNNTVTIVLHGDTDG